MAIQGECVIAVSAGVMHTITATRDGGVFGWGAAKMLGIPHAATVVVVRPGEADDAKDEDEERVRLLIVMSPHRYPQLSCVPRSSRAV